MMNSHQPFLNCAYVKSITEAIQFSLGCNAVLFNDLEVQFLNSFLALPTNSQRVLSRLLMRKRKWIKLESIKPYLLNPTDDVVEEIAALCKANMLEDLNNIDDFDKLWEATTMIFNMEDWNRFQKHNMNLNIRAQKNRNEFLKAIYASICTQKSCFGHSLKLTFMKAIRKYFHQEGSPIRLILDAALLFRRVQRLYQITSTIPTGTGLMSIYYPLEFVVPLMVSFKLLRYPVYTTQYTRPIFPSRAHFLHWENAMELRIILDTLEEMLKAYHNHNNNQVKPKISTILDFFQIVHTVIHAIILDTSSSDNINNKNNDNDTKENDRNNNQHPITQIASELLHVWQSQFDRDLQYLEYVCRRSGSEEQEQNNSSSGGDYGEEEQDRVILYGLQMLKLRLMLLIALYAQHVLRITHFPLPPSISHTPATSSSSKTINIEDNNDTIEEEEDYMLRYHAGNPLGYLLYAIAEVFEKEMLFSLPSCLVTSSSSSSSSSLILPRNYSFSNLCYEWLLLFPYLEHRRGKWYKRLVINYEHLKSPSSSSSSSVGELLSFLVIIRGLQDLHVLLSDEIDLRDRYISLTKKKKEVIWNTCEQLTLSAIEAEQTKKKKVVPKNENENEVPASSTAAKQRKATTTSRNKKSKSINNAVVESDTLAPSTSSASPTTVSSLFTYTQYYCLSNDDNYPSYSSQNQQQRKSNSFEYLNSLIALEVASYLQKLSSMCLPEITISSSSFSSSTSSHKKKEIGNNSSSNGAPLCRTPLSPPTTTKVVVTAATNNFVTNKTINSDIVGSNNFTTNTTSKLSTWSCIVCTYSNVTKFLTDRCAICQTPNQPTSSAASKLKPPKKITIMSSSEKRKSSSYEKKIQKEECIVIDMLSDSDNDYQDLLSTAKLTPGKARQRPRSLMQIISLDSDEDEAVVVAVKEGDVNEVSSLTETITNNTNTISNSCSNSNSIKKEVSVLQQYSLDKIITTCTEYLSTFLMPSTDNDNNNNTINIVSAVVKHHLQQQNQVTDVTTDPSDIIIDIDNNKKNNNNNNNNNILTLCWKFFVSFDNDNDHKLASISSSLSVDYDTIINSIQLKCFHIHGKRFFGDDGNDPKKRQGKSRFCGLNGELVSVEELVMQKCLTFDPDEQEELHGKEKEEEKEPQQEESVAVVAQEVIDMSVITDDANNMETQKDDDEVDNNDEEYANKRKNSKKTTTSNKRKRTSSTSKRKQISSLEEETQELLLNDIDVIISNNEEREINSLAELLIKDSSGDNKKKSIHTLFQRIPYTTAIGGNAAGNDVSDNITEASLICGGWEGWHCEGSIMHTLFGLYMWDIFYLPKENVFYNPYQDGPMDFPYPSFFQTREKDIQQRVSQLYHMLPSQLIEELANQYQTHYGKVNRVINWEGYSLASLQLASLCLSGKGIATICYAMCYRYKQLSSGAPDLFLMRIRDRQSGAIIPIETILQDTQWQQYPTATAASTSASSKKANNYRSRKSSNYYRGDDDWELTAPEVSPPQQHPLLARRATNLMNDEEPNNEEAIISLVGEEQDESNNGNNNDDSKKGIQLIHSIEEYLFEAMFVEVKGPSDHLAYKQLLWLQLLSLACIHPIQAYVCHVKEDITSS